MNIKTGTRYALPGGGAFLITKGSIGALTDGDLPLQANGATYQREPMREAVKTLQMGKRWAIIHRVTAEDDSGEQKTVESTSLEGLVLLPQGVREVAADLRLDGVELELVTPKVLPSAD